MIRIHSKLNITLKEDLLCEYGEALLMSLLNFKEIYDSDISKRELSKFVNIWIKKLNLLLLK